MRTSRPLMWAAVALLVAGAWITCVEFVCPLPALTTPAFAQSPRPEAAEAAAKPVDIVLALDNSGSMRQNDPKSLMREVVAGFAGRLGSGSRLGIVLFGDRADIVLPLTGTDVPEFRDLVAGSLKRIDYGGRRTDIPAGVERALYELRERGRSEAERTVVLLTDGIVDLGNPAKDAERARWLREALAEEARRLGIRIFGLAFTEAADFELMQSIAQTSGGDYFRVLAAEDIEGTFERVTARIQEIVQKAVVPAVVPQAPAAILHPGGSWQPWGLAAGAVLLALIVLAVVSRRGRRAPPEVRVPPATLYDRGGASGAQAYKITKAVTRVGREPGSSDVTIQQDTVSGVHAELVCREGAFYLRDLRSMNGTFVNGRKFSDQEEIREVPLKNRDRIRFDAYEFEFVLDTLAGAAQTVVAAGSGGTRLRAEPAPAVAPPRHVEPARAEPAGAAPGAGGDEAKTRLKTDMCPQHPAWKATEVCAVCNVARCKNCMREKDGKSVCTECLNKAA